MVRLIALALEVHAAGHFPLLEAKIVVGGTYHDNHYPADDFTGCLAQTINPAIVRSTFRTYHELKGNDVHDHYASCGCMLLGTITLYGKRFTFTYKYSHMPETDWPNGKYHLLGGTYSGDLSWERCPSSRLQHSRRPT